MLFTSQITLARARHRPSVQPHLIRALKGRLSSLGDSVGQMAKNDMKVPGPGKRRQLTSDRFDFLSKSTCCAEIIHAAARPSTKYNTHVAR